MLSALRRMEEAMAQADDAPHGPGGIESFLNPQSMLTPGILGALTMMVTNALALNFALPRAWTGIILSFVFGLLVFVTGVALFLRVVYYVANSLIIFCVAIGSNTVGLVAGPAPSASAVIISAPDATDNAPTVPSNADAVASALEDLAKQLAAVSDQIATNTARLDDLKAQGGASDEIAALTGEIAALREKKLAIVRDTLALATRNGAGEVPPANRTGGFFAPWGF